MFIDSALIELTEKEMFTLQMCSKWTASLFYKFFNISSNGIIGQRAPHAVFSLRGESTGPSLTLSALISPSRLAAVFMIQTEEK